MDVERRDGCDDLFGVGICLSYYVGEGIEISCQVFSLLPLLFVLSGVLLQ